MRLVSLINQEVEPRASLRDTEYTECGTRYTTGWVGGRCIPRVVGSAYTRREVYTHHVHPGTYTTCTPWYIHHLYTLVIYPGVAQGYIPGCGTGVHTRVVQRGVYPGSAERGIYPGLGEREASLWAILWEI